MNNGYVFYIDVSAKIEEWGKDSVIAVSNGQSRTLQVSASVKQAAAARLKGSTPVQFTLLAVFSYLALQPYIGNVSKIIIDRDYSGDVAHRIIKRQLVELIRKDRPTFKAAHIRIDNIAGTTADRLARTCYLQRRYDGVIRLDDIFEILGK